MTAVRGPFVFTSDRWSDGFIAGSKQAGCKSLALQLGVAPADAADKVRAAGLQVIGWGASDAPINTASLLSIMGAAVWMPQIESTAEFNALITCLNHGVFAGPCEPVATSAGMETEKPNATESEKVAERHRRRDLLRSFGVTKVWPEVYLQDAHRPGGNLILGDVDVMVSFYEQDLGFEEAHPVLGLWTVDAPWGQNPYKVSKYDLSKHGRTFGAWRAEQMAPERYTEMAAVSDVVVPPPPPPPPPKPNTAATRNEMAALGARWKKAYPDNERARITLATRLLNREFSDKVFREEISETIDLFLDGIVQ